VFPVIVKPLLKSREGVVHRITVTTSDGDRRKRSESGCVLVHVLVTRALQKVATVGLFGPEQRSVPLLELCQENGCVLASEQERLVEEVPYRAADHAIVDDTVVLRTGARDDRNRLVFECVKELFNPCFDPVGCLLVDSTLVWTCLNATLVEESYVFVGVPEFQRVSARKPDVKQQ
jgi:hypothetical protein